MPFQRAAAWASGFLAGTGRDIPEYVSPDGIANVTFARIPTLDQLSYPVRMEPNLVVEF